MTKSHSIEAETASRKATYQDVLDDPLHKVAEIVNGKLYTSPRPAPLYALAKSVLVPLIGVPFHFGRDGPGGWWILFEPEIHLGEDILVPDIAGWRRERVPLFPNVAYFTQAPDWACEVLSPSTRKLDLGGKRPVYAREGVGYLWLVDPDVQSLEAFKLRGTEWVLIDTQFDSAQISLSPFEAISFNLDHLWPPRDVHKKPPRKPAAGPEPEQSGTVK